MRHYFKFIPPEKSEKILKGVFTNHSNKFSAKSLFSKGYYNFVKRVLRKLLIEIGRILERLLTPYLNVRITPVDDGYKGLKDPTEFLYPEHLIPGKPKEPIYLNIGAGDFRHRMWHNLDYAPVLKKIKPQGLKNIDINHNLTSLKSLPIKSNSVKIVYSSHAIEHISDKAGMFLMQEIYRILIPGGTFRITCPNIQYYYDAYRNNNIHEFHEMLNPHKLGVDYSRASIQHFFVNHFAGGLHSDDRITDEYIDGIFNDLPFEEALDHFIKLLPKDSQSGYFHQSWYTEEKIIKYMKNVGFEIIIATGPAKSREPVLCTGQLSGFFDSTLGGSLFVECSKPLMEK